MAVEITVEDKREKRKAYMKAWRLANHEKVQANHKKWQQNNPERFKSIKKAANRAYSKKNKNKIAENWQAYVKVNSEKIKSRMKDYRQNNIQKAKEYYQINIEKIRIYKKKWAINYRNANPEIVKNYRKYYLKANPEKINALTSKRRAIKLHRTPTWFSDIDKFVIEEAFLLAKLREKTTGVKWHVDHIIPLQGKLISGLHIANNIQVIPAVKNMQKSNSYLVG